MRTACSSASSLRDGSAIALFTPPPPLPLPPSLLFTLNTTPKFLEEKFGDVRIAIAFFTPNITPEIPRGKVWGCLYSDRYKVLGDQTYFGIEKSK